MPEQNHTEGSSFARNLAAYALPLVLIVVGYLAQYNFERISKQLDRIEQRQRDDLTELSALKARIIILETHHPSPAIAHPRKRAEGDG